MMPIETTAAPLTAEEARILAAFREMDQRHRDQNLRTMKGDAKKYPARRPATLRLINGGGS